MNIIGTVLAYAGLLGSFLGSISLLRPLKIFGIATRLRGLSVLACGVGVFLVGENLPAPEVRIASPRTALDEFVPVYQFDELHSIRIQAPPERIFKAIKEVSADEIALFRALTWIRRFGRPGAEGILNAPRGVPILDVATETGFIKLAEELEREIVLGTAVVRPPGWRPSREPTPDQFKELHTPGFALSAINFRIDTEDSKDNRLTTETRVYATDASARRKFAAYWRVIYPGSALLRVTWLRAIRLRAERAPG